MTTKRLFAVLFCPLVVPVLLTGYLDGKEKKKPKNDVCSASTPASICDDANTCGSPASACEVDIKRAGGGSASETAGMPKSKSNVTFCVKVRTTITFKST